MDTALNKRQIVYLLAAYEFDQTAENQNKSSLLRGERSRPASDWRWIEYGPEGAPRIFNYDPPLRKLLKEEKLVDQGAGSTWKNLTERGFVLRRYEQQRFGQTLWDILYVQITRKGRRLARELLGETPDHKKKKPLSKGAWRVLCHLVQSENKKVFMPNVWHMASMPVPEPIICKMISNSLKCRGLVEVDGHYDNLHLTQIGQIFHREHIDEYLKLYPDVK